MTHGVGGQRTVFLERFNESAGTTIHLCFIGRGCGGDGGLTRKEKNDAAGEREGPGQKIAMARKLWFRNPSKNDRAMALWNCGEERIWFS